MNWQEKRDKARALLLEAQGIMNEPEATAEDREKAQKMFEDANALKAQAVKQREILTAIDDLDNLPEMPERKEADPAVTPPQTPGEFKDWGRYLQAVHNACNPKFRGEVDSRLSYFKDEVEAGHEEKQMVENVGASGGFLVPTQFLAQLHGIQAEDSIVRPRATIIRMQRRQIDIPVIDQTGTTASRPHWFGGMRFYWSEEAALKTLTEAEFRKVALVAHKLIGYTRASDELLADSAISLADFISGPLGFAGGVAWTEDDRFINGTGAGQPLGVITAGATITVPRAAIATPIQYVDLVNMYENFLPTGRGVWLFSQSAVSNLLTIQDPAGNYIWLPNMQHVAGTTNATLFGMPVIFTEKCPLVGSAGDAILADWRYYLIGDRQATTIESTQFDYWRYDQTSWRVVHRVDGRPWLSAPLTYSDGTTQVSPFVILGAKST